MRIVGEHLKNCAGVVLMVNRYDPAQRITAAEAVQSRYLICQPPLPADEAEIAEWLLATLAAADRVGTALKASTAAVAVKGLQLHQSHVLQQQQQASSLQLQQQEDSQRQRPPVWPPLALCWDTLPLA